MITCLIGHFSFESQVWRSPMTELYDWLSRQHHGLRTFQLLLVKLAGLREREPDKTALYVLLSQLVGRYIEAFDEKPVPVAAADRAHERLLQLFASLRRRASAEGQLCELNRVAAADLLEPVTVADSYSPSAAPRSTGDETEEIARGRA